MKRIISLLTLFVIGCEKNIESDYIGYDCDEVISYYQESVAPILSDHCIGCHSSSNASGSLALDSFDGAVSGIMNGDVINRINLETSSTLFMPRGSEKLSQQQLDIIQNFSELLCQ
tara:strand:+ start:1736 stop:2083 length:348 start_codon:yes stop_codon:yes gene_type:complete